jgi:hypothetical protein
MAIDPTRTNETCCRPWILGIVFGIVAARLIAPAIAGADEPEDAEPRRTPRLSAIRTDQPPDVDGRLDEPAWQKATDRADRASRAL